MKVFDMAVNPREAKGVRVWLNGEEVTRRSVRCEVPDEAGVDGPGSVMLLKQRDGHFYKDEETGGAAREVLTGTVRWAQT